MSESDDKSQSAGFDFSRARFSSDKGGGDKTDPETGGPDASSAETAGEPPENSAVSDTFEAPAPLSCQSCARHLNSHYFTANEQPLCANCRNLLEQNLQAYSGDTLLALTWGTGGAIVGAGAYYLVTALYAEVGLVALAVGIIVGKAVRRGAALSCHWRFRAMAMALTYLAIISTYLPAIVRGLQADGSGDSTFLTALSLALITPIFFAQIGNWIGLIILGIGIWEAHRYSAGPKLVLAGPFRITPPKGDLFPRK